MSSYLLNIFANVAPKWEQKFYFNCSYNKLPELAGCFIPFKFITKIAQTLKSPAESRLRYACVAQVCLARHPIVAFFEQKIPNF